MIRFLQKIYLLGIDFSVWSTIFHAPLFTFVIRDAARWGFWGSNSPRNRKLKSKSSISVYPKKSDIWPCLCSPWIFINVPKFILHSSQCSHHPIFIIYLQNYIHKWFICQIMIKQNALSLLKYNQLNANFLILCIHICAIQSQKKNMCLKTKWKRQQKKMLSSFFLCHSLPLVPYIHADDVQS